MLVSRKPGPALRPFVDRLWASAPSAGPASGRELILPTGKVHLVFRLSDGPLRVFGDLDDTVGRTFGTAVIGGPRSGAYVKDLTRPVPSIGIVLRPGAASALFGIPAAELAERHTPLHDLWGNRCDLFREQLHDAPTLESRLETCERWLTRRFTTADLTLPPVISHALARLPHMQAVGELVTETGVSHRHFNMLFRQTVGLLPKTYWRLLRLQRALQQLHRDRDLPLADLAALAGYSDQSHLNREFRAFTGLTPGRYRLLSPAASHHVPLPSRTT